MKKKALKQLGVFLLLILSVIATVELRKAIQCEQPVCDIEPQSISASVSRDKAGSKPLPTLLDFGAGQCATCKMMDAVLTELAMKYAEKIKIRSINVHEQEKQTKQYDIRMIPTQIFLDANNNELFRHEGFLSKEDVVKKWKELGVVL
jgi:thiol-disulfide isomerase/thioredoxin